MDCYKIEFKKSVYKDLKKIPKSDIKKIVAKIDTLKTHPRGPGAVKLAGQDAYRQRVGLYRIVYKILDHVVTVQVIKVGHRRDVYS